MACRNYHVFYYLLMGASKEEREEFHLLRPQDYLYLKQVPLVYTPYGNSHAGRGRPTQHIVAFLQMVVVGVGLFVIFSFLFRNLVFRRMKSMSFSYVSHMFVIIISLKNVDV